MDEAASLKFQSLQVKASDKGGEKLLTLLSSHCWYLNGFEQRKHQQDGAVAHCSTDGGGPLFPFALMIHPSHTFVPHVFSEAKAVLHM